MKKDGATKFDRAVPKSENIGVQTTKGLVFLYVAVNDFSELCKKCFPPRSQKEAMVPCEKKCYGNKCPACDYWGHSRASYLQIKKKDGTDIVNE